MPARETSIWQAVSQVGPDERCRFCAMLVPQAARKVGSRHSKPIAFRHRVTGELECKLCRAEAMRADAARALQAIATNI